MPQTTSWTRGEPTVIDGEDGPLDGCYDYDPCAYEGVWGWRRVQRFSCGNQETLIGILAFIGSFAAGSFCAIIAGPVGWAAAGAVGGACGGMAYRFMDNARNDQSLLDGVFDPKAIAIDAAIGVAVAGAARGVSLRWGRARGGSSGAGGASDDAARAGAAPRCSFSAETRVLMADGSTKPISEVEVGDEVWATDPETGESGPRRVDAELPHTDQLLTLRTSAGDIVTTEDHEYWNETDEEWQGAQDLDEGDRLRTADGAVVTVEGLDWSTLHTATAYDLDVAGIDTFYVATADTEVLVHNCDIRSLIGNDARLVKEAQTAARANQADIDQLTRELANGNLNPGRGTKHLFGSVRYARHRNGARVFFRAADGVVEILAKANKHNESRVIQLVKEIYG